MGWVEWRVVEEREGEDEKSAFLYPPKTTHIPPFASLLQRLLWSHTVASLSSNQQRIEAEGGGRTGREWGRYIRRNEEDLQLPAHRYVPLLLRRARRASVYVELSSRSGVNPSSPVVVLVRFDGVRSSIVHLLFARAWSFRRVLSSDLAYR